MTFTVSEIIDRARALAAERPTFVYRALPVDRPGSGVINQCRYVEDDGSKGCIFGHALIDLGMSKADLSQYEGNAICDIVLTLDLPVTEDERRWMQRVQGEQDTLVPWGAAVADTDRLYPEV